MRRARRKKSQFHRRFGVLGIFLGGLGGPNISPAAFTRLPWAFTRSPCDPRGCATKLRETASRLAWRRPRLALPFCSKANAD